MARTTLGQPQARPQPAARLGPAANVAESAMPALPLAAVKPIVVCATATVLLLGVARELVIARIGTGTWLKDLRPISLDSEHCLGAWYESSLMLAAAVLLFVIGTGERRRHDRRHHWLALALVFVALSIDESVSLHEVLIEPLRGALGTGGFLYFAWVLPGSLVVLVCGLAFVPFLLSLPRPLAARIAAGGALFVGGALGMELVGGYLVATQGWRSTGYIAAAIVEEGLELIGLTVFFNALVDHLLAGRQYRLLSAG